MMFTDLTHPVSEHASRALNRRVPAAYHRLMKHATSVALDGIEPLLVEIRRIDGLVEKKRGVFYRKSSAALHFHEDPAGFFADARIGPEWVRFAVNTAKERRALVGALRTAYHDAAM
jgi:hypothetical protein